MQHLRCCGAIKPLQATFRSAVLSRILSATSKCLICRRVCNVREILLFGSKLVEIRESGWGVLESQLSAKFSAISQLSAKFSAISQLSANVDKSQLFFFFCRILHSCNFLNNLKRINYLVSKTFRSFSKNV